MLNFNISPLIWFVLSIIFIIILFLTSKWGIKKLFSIFEVEESWYKALDVVYSILKVLLVASGIIFIASRIFFQDVTVKSYNTDVQTQVEEHNQKLLDNTKPFDPNEAERLNQQHLLEHTYEVEDKIREKKRKARDEFQKFLDTL